MTVLDDDEPLDELSVVVFGLWGLFAGACAALRDDAAFHEDFGRRVTAAARRQILVEGMAASERAGALTHILLEMCDELAKTGRTLGPQGIVRLWREESVDD